MHALEHQHVAFLWNMNFIATETQIHNSYNSYTCARWWCQAPSLMYCMHTKKLIIETTTVKIDIEEKILLQ